jgi:hypothetical protein
MIYTIDLSTVNPTIILSIVITTTTYQTTMSLKLLSLPFCHYHSHLWEQSGILLLSTMTKMILTGCSVTQVIMRHDRHSLPQRCNYSIVKIVPTETIITSIAPSTFVTTASCMLLTIANPTVQTIEAGDFNLSGDNVTNNYFSSFLLL